jgi:alkaline phosphatase D
VEEAESIVSDVTSILTSAVESPSAVLETLLAEPPKKELTPEFMILAGDAIYADVPWYDGDNAESYRKKYRRSYASSSYRKVYEKLRK